MATINLRDKVLWSWMLMKERYEMLYPTAPKYKELEVFVCNEMSEFFFFVMSDPRYTNTPWAYKTIDQVHGQATLGYYSVTQFQNAFSCYALAYRDKDGKRQYKSIYKIYSNSSNRLSYHYVYMNPRLIENDIAYNMYQGLMYEIDPSVKLYKQNLNLIDAYIRHLYGLNENQNEINFLLDWMSFSLQKPWEQARSFVAYVGPQGMGKNTAILPFMWMFGNHGFKIENAKLLIKWNSMLDDKIMVFCDEAVTTKEFMMIMGNWVTESARMSTRKYSHDTFVLNFLKWILATENEENLFFSEKNRRYFIMDCMQGSYARSGIPDKDYYTHLNEMYKPGTLGHQVLFGFLMSREITPSFGVGEAPPKTNLHIKMVREKQSSVTTWWGYVLSVGQHTAEEEMIDMNSNMSWTSTVGREKSGVRSKWVCEVMKDILYNSYSKWCIPQNEVPKSKQLFFKELSALTNITHTKHNGSKIEQIKHRLQHSGGNSQMKSYIILPNLDEARNIFNAKHDIKHSDYEVAESNNWYEESNVQLSQEESIEIPIQMPSEENRLKRNVEEMDDPKPNVENPSEPNDKVVKRRLLK